MLFLCLRFLRSIRFGMFGCLLRRLGRIAVDILALLSALLLVKELLLELALLSASRWGLLLVELLVLL